MDCIRYYDSPLGRIALSSDGAHITGLRFEGQAGFLTAGEEAPLPVFEEAVRWLDLYFSGRDPGFAPPLDPRGTPFRRAVWELLRTIPFGETLTYGEIAARLPRASARAVGGAAGHNPILLMIPCHRVVGKDGVMTGYAGGVWRKEWLLGNEERH